MNNNSVVDWNEVMRRIPGSDNLDGPINIIRESFNCSESQDPFDQVDKRLNLFIDELNNSFERLTKL